MSRSESPITCCAPVAAPTLSDEEADATAALFRALGDPARLKILNVLARTGEPVCVCDFTAPLGLAQPTVSHHLRRLTEAGLLEREQRGRWAYYGLASDALRGVAALVDLEEVPA
jgi:ArsR family transcriptional regulator, arsenate/arsenite/antimonite-responsive transcriptional repressor